MLSLVLQFRSMKVALLLVLIGAVAAPSFCWVVPSLPDIWSAPIQKGLESGKALVEKVKAEVDKLLSESNKEKARKLLYDIWSVPVQKTLESGKALVEKAKTEGDKLLSEGNKEKAAQLINDAILTIKKTLDSLHRVMKVIPGVSEKVKEAVAKATAVLDDLKAKAQEAAKQENVEKVKAALQEAISKVASQIKDILSQLRAPRDN